MKQNFLIKGIGASPGITIAKVLLVDHGHPDFSHYRLKGEQEILDETARFKNALAESKAQLTKAKREVARKKIKEAQYIIDTHIFQNNI